MSKDSNPKIETGEVSAESQYKALSEEDLKKLAIGVVNGNVFGTWSLPERDTHLIPNIFMVTIFLDDIQRKEMKRDGVVHMYEWFDKAGPRAINGYPTFMSAHFLNREDSIRLQEKCKQVQEALDAL